MTPVGLHERLKAAAGRQTIRTISEFTNTPVETVRRYMTTNALDAEFLTLFCCSLGINGDWLLAGREPMKTGDMQYHALGEAKAGDLLGAMAGSLAVLIDRVDRTEKFVQTLETRMRVGQRENVNAGTIGGAVELAKKLTPHGDKHAQTEGRAGNEPSGEQRAAQAREQARRIADAITGRPRPDDD